MKQNISKFIFLLTVVLAVTVLNCGDDCPVCPGDNPPDLGEYYLIGYDITRQIIVLVDVPADTIIDTIHCGYESRDMVLHPDGDKIMIQNLDDGTIELYQTSNLEHVGTMEQFGIYYFDIYDNYGLWFQPQENNLYKIDNFSMFPIDTIENIMIYDSYLDTTNNVFYAPIFEDTLIYKIDCNTMEVIDTFYTASSVRELVYSHLSNEIFYISPLMYNGVLYRFDVDTGEHTILDFLTHTTGAVRITPDGKYILATDGADPLHGRFSNPYIYLYDIENTKLDYIPCTPFLVHPSAGLIIFGNIAITSDNCRAYVCAVPSYYGGPSPAGVIDLHTMKMTHTVEKPTEYFEYTNIVLAPKL